MDKKGFTFVELMVVMALIGMLVMIGVNQYYVANYNAGIDSVESDLRMIGNDVTTYIMDNWDVRGEREVEIPIEEREDFAKGVMDGLSAYLEVGVGLEWDGEKKEGYVVGILRNKLDYWGTPYEVYLDYAEGTAMIVSLGPDTKKDSEKYYEGYFGDDIVMLITNDKGVK